MVQLVQPTTAWLEDVVPELHARDLSVRAELDDTYTKGKLHVELDLTGSAPSSGQAQVHLTLPDAAGEVTE